jgi:hypothetical protein
MEKSTVEQLQEQVSEFLENEEEYVYKPSRKERRTPTFEKHKTKAQLLHEINKLRGYLVQVVLYPEMESSKKIIEGIKIHQNIY